MSKSRFTDPDLFIPPQVGAEGPAQVAQPVENDTARYFPAAPPGYEYVPEAEWTPAQRQATSLTGVWATRPISDAPKAKADKGLAQQGLTNALALVDSITGATMALNSTAIRRELTYVLQYAIAALTDGEEPVF